MTMLGSVIIAPLIIGHTFALAWTPSPVAVRFRTPSAVNHEIIFPLTPMKKSSSKLSNKLSTVEENVEISPTEATDSDQSPSPKPLQIAAASKKSYGKGVWVPPSQNISQRKGKVFAIQQPQDLLDFVIEDERLSVVKVYASWCKTCKAFDVRYRKIANQYGDQYDSSGRSIVQKGRVRFAEMQYDNPNNEEMCQLLNATKLPYMLIYKGSKGKLADFTCNTSTVQKLYDAINDLADSEEVISSGAVATPITAEAAAAARKSVAMMNVNGNQESKENISKDINAVAVTARLDEMKKILTEKEAMIESLERMVESSNKMIADYEERIESKDIEVERLRAEINNQKEYHLEELTKHSTEIDELSRIVAKNNKTIISLELELSYQQKAAKSAIDERTRKMKKWEEMKSEYERERRSLRKLSGLAVERVKFGVRSLLSKLRRKKSE